MPQSSSDSHDENFVTLLTHHGYAQEVALLLRDISVVDVNASKEAVKARFSEFSGNYYMQYLALKLHQFGYQLNRPLISPADLHLAGNLIDGKMGNPPLDMAHLITLLHKAVEYFTQAHDIAPLTWQQFFETSYLAQDGSVIRGQDILRGLVKSDEMTKGAQFEPYQHHFGGRLFATLAMKFVVADALLTHSPKSLKAINRFGQKINAEHVKLARSLTLQLKQLQEPRLVAYFDVNSHKRIRKTLYEIAANLLQKTIDTSLLHHQALQLTQDYYNPAMYPPPWQLFIKHLLLSIEMIATPYE